MKKKACAESNPFKQNKKIMKALQYFSKIVLLVILVSITGFSPAKKLTSSFTVTLSNMPVQGNTEYNLIVSTPSGNNAYQLTPYTGFVVLSKNPVDATVGQNTIFRIKTYPNVYHIAGNVTAYTCTPSCSPSGNQYFSF